MHFKAGYGCQLHQTPIPCLHVVYNGICSRWVYHPLCNTLTYNDTWCIHFMIKLSRLYETLWQMLEKSEADLCPFLWRVWHCMSLSDIVQLFICSSPRFPFQSLFLSIVDVFLLVIWHFCPLIILLRPYWLLPSHRVLLTWTIDPIHSGT